jgi:transglutaminase-like putative cysteine protease
MSTDMIQYVGPRTALSGTLPPGNQGARATLSIMRELTLSGAKDPIVRETAIRIVQTSGAREHNPASQLGALFRYVRDRITFIGDVAGVETLQTPQYTLRVGAGDCDDRAVLLAAMARSIGITADLRFRAVAANPRTPGQLSHVYVVARIGNQDLPLDPTYKSAEPGYQYSRVTRVEDLRL